MYFSFFFFFAWVSGGGWLRVVVGEGGIWWKRRMRRKSVGQSERSRNAHMQTHAASNFRCASCSENVELSKLNPRCDLCVMSVNERSVVISPPPTHFHHQTVHLLCLALMNGHTTLTHVLIYTCVCVCVCVCIHSHKFKFLFVRNDWSLRST